MSIAASSRSSTDAFHRVLHVRAVVVMLLLVTGCSSNKFLTVRQVPRNPLEGPLRLVSYSGPQPTERTTQLVRRYALSDAKQSSDEVLGKLYDEIAKEPTSEKIYSFAELSFIAAKKAEASGDEGQALDHYAASVAHAYLFLFSPTYDPQRNPYDPQFRAACDVYNSSLEGSLRLANKRGALKPGKSEVINTGKQQYHVNVVMRGAWRAEEIEKLEFVNDYQIQGGLKNHYHTYGLGVPLIAVRKKPQQSDHVAERYYPPGLAFPATAFLRVMPPAEKESQTAVRQCVLELCDPLASTDIRVSGRVAPIETDLTVPLAFLLDSPDFKKRDVATLGLFNPDAAQELEGLFMLEPYDPRRIPVVMVHGLWSSPTTWMEMFNDLRAFPEIRERYQFWFFQYPTGKPFWESAARFRETLADVRRTLDPRAENPLLDQMVLVGHSMGGLVSRMQTIESGDDFWHILSDRPLAELKADDAVRAKLSSVLYFHPNPSVKRVITLGTPHEGSHFVNDYARWAGKTFITLPEMMTHLTNQITRDNPNFFRDTAFITCSTSIDSLSPDSPIFPVLKKSQRAPWVKYNNLVGVAPKETLFGKLSSDSDGVVSLQNAHLDGAETEISIPADHLGVHRHPLATLELRRILTVHWNEAATALAGIMPIEQLVVGTTATSPASLGPAE